RTTQRAQGKSDLPLPGRPSATGRCRPPRAEEMRESMHDAEGVGISGIDLRGGVAPPPLPSPQGGEWRRDQGSCRGATTYSVSFPRKWEAILRCLHRHLAAVAVSGMGPRFRGGDTGGVKRGEEQAQVGAVLAFS